MFDKELILEYYNEILNINNYKVGLIKIRSINKYWYSINVYYTHTTDLYNFFDINIQKEDLKKYVITKRRDKINKIKSYLVKK